MPGNGDVSRFQEAFDKVREELKAVATSDYVLINTDIPTAVTTVLGALPGIQALRQRVVTELPRLDIARFDKLETYALALGHAHAGYMAASQPVEALEKLTEEGAALRELLYSDAQALAQRGILDRERLKGLKGVKGYRNLAFDLLTLARLFRENLPAINGKCAVQMGEIQRAEQLTERILKAVGHREQAPATVVEAAEMRQRAFTLFVGAYENVQRAARFLRWDEEDWDNITPTIYNSNRPRRRETEEVPEAPSTAPAVPGASKPKNGPGVPVPVGMPNSDPFASS
jgi:hypothetical protein